MALRVEDIDLAADRELVERWQAGEHEVFDDLYRRYYGRLTSYCRKRVGDRDTAEEIAQEAFVKALQALPRFAGERRFYPWMTVIASRLCVDHHRRVGRVRPVEELDPGTVDGDHGARLAFLADVDNLDRALQRLGPRHAEVLEMREHRGMTYAQIAEHLDVPQSTVEALLFRARKALRREFLALAGDGRLASLPVIGLFVRRLADAKARVAEALPSLSQLGAPVAASAVAAVISAAPFASTGATAAAPVVPRPHVVQIASTSVPTAPTVPAAAAPAPATPAAPVRPHLALSPPVSAAVTTMTADEARHSAAAMPLLADLGGLGLGIGIDPTEVLGWLHLDQEEE